MNKENFALKLVDEIILYYDARSKKHQIKCFVLVSRICVVGAATGHYVRTGYVQQP